MVIRIGTEYQLCDQFRSYNRDYFSIDGYSALLRYYDEEDENTEVDVPSICEQFTEYGNGGCAFDFSDLVHDYGYMLDCDEDLYWDSENPEYIEDLVSELSRYTYVERLSNGDVLLIDF